jgi:hypothetical protein
VLPLIQAFGAEVLSGMELAGKALVPGVQEQIRKADGVLGFRTIRDQAIKDGHDGKKSHQWVHDELTTAIGVKKLADRVIEIREAGVDSQKMYEDRVCIHYHPGRRDECLLELATYLSAWRRASPLRVKLLPEDFVKAIRPHLRKKGVRCTYTWLEGPEESEAQQAEVRDFATGGLGIYVEGGAPGAVLNVRVEANGAVWESGFESVEFPSLHLIPQP